MLLTKASEYALLSISLLANKNEPQDADTLSSILGIPKSFLAKILQALARAGILKSYKGTKGGFILLKDPKDIVILDIINVVEVKSANVFECSNNKEVCGGGEEKANSCVIWPYLNKLQNKIDGFLSEVTLEDLLEK
jgi:Rrf2 family transcriptional regulator, iron-sulfur cluster assembly transcription factor